MLRSAAEPAGPGTQLVSAGYFVEISEGLGMAGCGCSVLTPVRTAIQYVAWGVATLRELPSGTETRRYRTLSTCISL